jgi:hypothetical protein
MCIKLLGCWFWEEFATLNFEKRQSLEKLVKSASYNVTILIFVK